MGPLHTPEQERELSRRATQNQLSTLRSKLNQINGAIEKLYTQLDKAETTRYYLEEELRQIEVNRVKDAIKESERKAR